MRYSFIIISILLIATACGKKPTAQSIEPIIEDEEIIPIEPAEPIGGGDLEEEIVYPYTFPFTGMGTEEEATERPIMVMVENQAQARPQNGLSEADLVYEILAEGDITRFVAVYQSKSPEVIGPVRSIRPYFVEIGDGLDALIVHAGWSQEAINMIKGRKLAHFDEVYGDDAYYWRDKTRKAPHNLYTSTELIRKGAEKKKYREDWNDPELLFADPKDVISGGQPATKVDIHYIQKYYVTYEYDEETKLYNRSMEGKPHLEKDSEVQLTATNILALRSPHRILDDVGRRSVNVFGPGKGYLIQQGQVRDITWERKDGVIRPYIDGEEVGLIPGQTWIHIIPENSEVKIEP